MGLILQAHINLYLYFLSWASFLVTHEITLISFKPRTKKSEKIVDFSAKNRFFGGAGKDFRVEKSFAKKSEKNRKKSPIFRRKIGKIRYFPEKFRFFPKKSDFSRNLGKLYFRSLRGEKLKIGAKQSCRIKKKCIFGKNNSCLVH